MEELEKAFNDIKKEIEEKGYNYQKIINSGNVLIPSILLKNKKIKINEKIYLSLYYINEKNISKADKEMLEVLNINKLKRIKNNLSKLKYIKKIKLNNIKAKELTIKLSHTKNICEWCGNKSYILHEHHFPIPRKDKGEKVVKICPNCHCTYHYLLETNIYE